MGVADCAYAEAAASNAALVIKPKSFVILGFLLICIQHRVLEKVADISMPRGRRRKLPHFAGAFCCPLFDGGS
jgi:hypothetical protein